MKRKLGSGVVAVLAFSGLVYWLFSWDKTDARPSRIFSETRITVAAHNSSLAPQPELGNGQTPDLEQGFAEPPAWAKPRVYWWWLFNRVDKAGITRDLEQFKARGISGVNLICTGGYAGRMPLFGVKFLGPEWRELFRHAVKEAARLGIEMGFNLAGGWVMIGPWVTKDNAMKKVVQAETAVKGPRKFSGPAPQPEILDGYYKDVWVQAFPLRADSAASDNAGPGRAVEPKEIIDLTDRLRPDGTLDWDVPAGEWSILRTGYTLTGSRWNPYPLGDTSIESAG